MSLYIRQFGFRGFIAEALDKGFRIFYLFLLILIGTELLFTTFLPQYDKFVILHFVVGSGVGAAVGAAVGAGVAVGAAVGVAVGVGLGEDVSVPGPMR